ncbi:Hypothetical protein NAEGRDRAFT_74836 [Naegleria gruberi]|uniref:LRR_RI domain-containing protein n=1 Tax=Naegleria gruberi TaxID=5762 RepID=D2W0F1_NAEGR|nr:uncharacterized protein NAEGRDRAFT_74836 [Naegleria gruberi]EFC37421.1 Hypothetical protein NAEGRDRAFT_74836 [Naegleria gruberi]|eukprot:XP_002670165.1 Hypothetical protein NAEGRDRAFT_74836 [Naegleria gruberi strain NEG-M]
MKRLIIGLQDLKIFNSNLSNLTDLDLYETNLDMEGIDKLIQLKHLTRLNIQYSSADSCEPILAMFANTNWKKLKSLNLLALIVKEKKVPLIKDVEIVPCGFKPELEKLVLAESQISGNLLKHLLNCEILSNLQILDLSYLCFVYSNSSIHNLDGVLAIANSKCLKNLRILKLYQSYMDSDCIKLIAERGCQTLPNLQSLDLRMGQLGDESFEKIMEYEFMQNLELLFVMLSAENNNSYFLTTVSAKAILKNSKKMKKSLYEAYEYYVHVGGIIDIERDYQNYQVEEGPKLLGAIVNHGSDWDYGVDELELLSES